MKHCMIFVLFLCLVTSKSRLRTFDFRNPVMYVDIREEDEEAEAAAEENDEEEEAEKEENSSAVLSPVLPVNASQTSM